MKIQIVKCKTCGKVFAACLDKHADADWYKDCAKHLSKGNAIIETIKSDGNVFGGEPLNKCCGKSVKQLAKINIQPQIL